MKILNLFCLWIILQFSLWPVVAASFFEQFIDPTDGKLDASQWLAGKTGFLPVPIIISDPAVGYGGGLAAVFFHDTEESAADLQDINAPLSLPPSISFLAGAYTENESWLLGGGHMAIWKNGSSQKCVPGYGQKVM